MFVGEGDGFRLGEGEDEEFGLSWGEVEVGRFRTAGEATAGVLEGGEGRIFGGGGLDVIVALGAAEVSEVGLAFGGEDGVDFEGFDDGNGLVGGGEERRGNGFAGKAGAFHFQGEIGFAAGVEVGELDGVEA